MLAGDVNFMRVFRDGLDPHGMLAAETFGTNFTKLDRDNAKTTNYGALYGAGDSTLWEQYVKKGVFLPYETVSNFLGAFWRLHPELQTYMREQLKRALSHKPLEAPAWGYSWTVKDFLMVGGHGDVEGAARGVANAVIQCVPPRLTLEALEKLDRMGVDVRLHTHDGGLIYADEDKAEETTKLAVQVFNDTAASYDFWRGTPCRSAGKFGPSWGEGKEVAA